MPQFPLSQMNLQTESNLAATVVVSFAQRLASFAWGNMNVRNAVDKALEEPHRGDDWRSPKQSYIPVRNGYDHPQPPHFDFGCHGNALAHTLTPFLLPSLLNLPRFAAIENACT